MTPDCFAHMTALLQPIAPLAVLLEVNPAVELTVYILDLRKSTADVRAYLSNTWHSLPNIPDWPVP